MTDSPIVKTRSKRLRKKLYVDEFTVLGFGFHGKFSAETDAELDPFFDGLVELIEGRNLMICGGNDGEHFEAYVSSSERYESATDEDRKAVQEWLDSQASITDVVVTELSDAYYGE